MTEASATERAEPVPGIPLASIFNDLTLLAEHMNTAAERLTATAEIFTGMAAGFAHQVALTRMLIGLDEKDMPQA